MEDSNSVCLLTFITSHVISWVGGPCNGNSLQVTAIKFIIATEMGNNSVSMHYLELEVSC